MNFSRSAMAASSCFFFSVPCASISFRSAEREKFIAPVPEELRDLYGRIAKRHNGTAMAEARDGQCRGCGMRVLPHILQQLRTETSEEVYRCESCGLILYTLEPIPVANPADASSAASTNH